MELQHIPQRDKVRDVSVILNKLPASHKFYDDEEALLELHDEDDDFI